MLVITREECEKIQNRTGRQKIKKERAEAIDKMQNGPIMLQQGDGQPPIELNHQQVVQFIKQLQQKNEELIQQNSQIQNAYNHLHNVIITMEKSLFETKKLIP